MEQLWTTTYILLKMAFISNANIFSLFHASKKNVFVYGKCVYVLYVFKNMPQGL